MSAPLDLKIFRTVVNSPDIRAEFWDTAYCQPDTSLGHFLFLVAEKYDHLSAAAPIDRTALKAALKSPVVQGEMTDAGSAKPDASYGSFLQAIVDAYEKASDRK
jgi:hypothetical protein